MTQHLVQSPEWGDFKSEFGTPAIRVGNVQYTKHKLPFTNFYYAYCPKVNPFEIQWGELTNSLKLNNCFTINFDVPYVQKDSPQAEEAVKIFRSQENVKPSPKNTFTKYNIILDISKPEEALLMGMHTKHRYNARKSEKEGVKVRKGQIHKDFEIFYELLEETGKRQKFLNHPKEYYKKIWEMFYPKQIAHLLIAEYQNKPLASWMLFTHQNTLYYPYGGSSNENRNLFASNLIGWEAIKLGKAYGCTKFDMWGACADPTDQTDPEWGFTNFKLRFGGTHIEYMDSYDYILNPTVYNLFNTTYPKVMRFLKAIR